MLMPAIVAAPRRRPAPPEATQAGTPDPVVRRAARPPARAARPRRPGPAPTRSRWPTAYCGRPPPQRVTRASTGGSVTPSASVRSASTRSTRSASSRCSTASSPSRPTEARTTTRPGAASAYQPHFVEENVDRLDRAARPPAAPGSRSRSAAPGRPSPGRRARRRPSTRSASGPARTPPPARVRAQQPGRWRPPARRAPPRRPATASGDRASDPTTSRQPVGGAAPARGRWRRCGPSAPESRGHRRRQPADAAAGRAEHRAVAARPASAAARLARAAASSERSRRACGASCGHRGLQRELVGPPGVDPAEQRLDQPVDDRPAHPARRRSGPTDDVARRSGSAAATSRPAPGPARAPVSSPLRGQRAQVARARPSRSPRGSGCSAPRRPDRRRWWSRRPPGRRRARRPGPAPPPRAGAAAATRRPRRPARRPAR